MMFRDVLFSEFLKLRRTKITWIVALLYCFGPMSLGLFMIMLKEPELARSMGLIATKAQLTVGTADWPTYFSSIAMVLSFGAIVIGIIEAFVFGREYAEGTAKNMLTLPIGRSTFVAAKIVVSIVWYACIVAVVYGLALLLGVFGEFPDSNLFCSRETVSWLFESSSKPSC